MYQTVIDAGCKKDTGACLHKQSPRLLQPIFVDLTTTRSVSLEINDSILEMGRYELNDSGSVLDFLNEGRTRVCLS